MDIKGTKSIQIIIALVIAVLVIVGGVVIWRMVHNTRTISPAQQAGQVLAPTAGNPPTTQTSAATPSAPAPVLVKEGAVCTIQGNTLSVDISGGSVCNPQSKDVLSVTANSSTKIISFDNQVLYGSAGVAVIKPNDGVKVFSPVNITGRTAIIASEIDVTRTTIVTQEPTATGTKTAITTVQNTPSTLPTVIFNVIGKLTAISGSTLTVNISANSLYPNKTGTMDVTVRLTPNTNVFVGDHQYTGLAGSEFLIVNQDVSVQATTNIYEQSDFDAANIRQ